MRDVRGVQRQLPFALEFLLFQPQPFVEFVEFRGAAVHRQFCLVQFLRALIEPLAFFGQRRAPSVELIDSCTQFCHAAVGVGGPFGEPCDARLAGRDFGLARYQIRFA